MKNYKELTEKDFLYFKEKTTFNTFIELCNFLEIETPVANSKKAALKIIEQYCEIVFYGRKIELKKRENILPKKTTTTFKWKDTIFDDPKVIKKATFLISYENDSKKYNMLNKYSILKALGLSYEEIGLTIKNDLMKEESLENIENLTIIENLDLLHSLNTNFASLINFWLIQGYIKSAKEEEFFLEYRIDSKVDSDKTSVWLEDSKFLLNESQKIEVEAINQQLLLEYEVKDLSDIVRNGKWKEFVNKRAKLSNYKYFNIKKGYLINF